MTLLCPICLEWLLLLPSSLLYKDLSILFASSLFVTIEADPEFICIDCRESMSLLGSCGGRRKLTLAGDDELEDFGFCFVTCFNLVFKFRLIFGELSSERWLRLEPFEDLRELKKVTFGLIIKFSLIDKRKFWFKLGPDFKFNY